MLPWITEISNCIASDRLPLISTFWDRPDKYVLNHLSALPLIPILDSFFKSIEWEHTSNAFFKVKKYSNAIVSVVQSRWYIVRSETKRSEIQVYFFAFFTCFPIIFVSLRFFHLIFAYFTFVFASDFWRFASKWIMWNQAFFSLPSETKFSLQFQISLPKRKWGRTLVGGWHRDSCQGDSGGPLVVKVRG